MTNQTAISNSPGNSHIDEDIIRKHMPLVRQIAQKIAARSPASVTSDDLYSAGSLGLVDSIIKNNGGEGAAFSYYVRMRIKGAIYDEMRTSDWLPRRNRSRDADKKTDGPAPPLAVIRFDDLPPGKERNPVNRSNHSNPFDMLDSKRSNQKLTAALNSVSSRDRLVLHLHYFRGMQVREIGRLLGISDARVSQIHHKALEHIRPILEQT
jgi:RNA polymerase sigma factor for flagellar operon FliA